MPFFFALRKREKRKGKKEKMWLFIFILIIVIMSAYVAAHKNPQGSAEIVQNKKQLKSEQIVLSNKDFESFVDRRKLKSRLVYIGGAHLSGKTHLAKMIAKKMGFEHINGCEKTPQEVRRMIRIDDSPGESKSEKAAVEKRIAVEREKRKYVICGDFSDDELSVLFKGRGHNRNFIFLFVVPQEDAAAAWRKCTGHEKEEYSKVLSETNKLLKEHKKYRMYLVKNSF